MGTSTPVVTVSADDWGTPASVFDPLDAEFRFDLDVAASDWNAKCGRYFTVSDNALWLPWAPARCWMNPPYGRELAAWVSKAHAEAGRGALVVGLLPARVDVRWFHDHVVDVGAEVRFVRGRIAFDRPRSWQGTLRRDSSPFPSMIVVWRPTA